jgi:hypothetical protein
MCLARRFTIGSKVITSPRLIANGLLKFKSIGTTSLARVVQLAIAPISSADGTTPIRREIRVADQGQVFARFTDGFEILAALPEVHQQMREALVARYFPWAAETLLGDTIFQEAEAPQAAEDAADYGRSPAFRRTILDIYDHQCAACGLRICLPADHERTKVPLQQKEHALEPWTPKKWVTCIFLYLLL